ncbi:hypothetical protein HGRIS_005545 [Hohenbuehelia grisea]|uniref:Uncharacterized protein n=1 Tax=Hohenbuehelia grisea TaxID=104357 RepID=A0ABR3JXC2_9AGAR
MAEESVQFHGLPIITSIQALCSRTFVGFLDEHPGSITSKLPASQGYPINRCDLSFPCLRTCVVSALRDMGKTTYGAHFAIDTAFKFEQRRDHDVSQMNMGTRFRSSLTRLI